MKNPFQKLLEIQEIEKDVEGPTQRVIKAKQKTLEKSIREGVVARFASSIATSYITPFALVLKATSFQIGLLSSLSGLIAPFSQLYGSKLMIAHSRKKIVLRFVFLQSLIWLPIAFISYLAIKELPLDYLVYGLIALFVLMVGLGEAMVPAWFSWIGDIIPERDRGKYLSIRNRAIEIVGLTAILVGAFILDAFKTYGFALLGFGVLFIIASLFRFISFVYLKKLYSPKFRVRKRSHFSFFEFIRRFDNYGKFAVYQAAFFFSLMVASPFFAVYMLEELHFSYVTFTIVSMSSSVFYLLFASLAGKFSDKFGNMKLFYIANFLFAISPLFWLLFKDPITLILIPSLIAGIANAAFLIASTNFTYNAVSQQHRGLCIAYESMLLGAGTFIGSLLGGFLIDYAPWEDINPFFLVFIVAALLRLLVGLLFLPHIKEQRKVKKLPPMLVDLIRPIKTLHAEISWFKRVFK